MRERVDVLAYDEPVDSQRDEDEGTSPLVFGAWVVAAVAVGYGVFAGRVLLGALASTPFVGLAVFLSGTDETEVRTRYRTTEAGRGEAVVAAHEAEARKRGLLRAALLAVVAAVVLAWAVLRGSLLLGVLAAGVIGAVAVLDRPDPALPRLVEEDLDRERAERRFDLEPDGAADSGPKSDGEDGSHAGRTER